MDLNEILQTTAEFDIKKPWGILIAQIVYDCFRKYAIDYIETQQVKTYDSLYELVEVYIDEPFKKYLGELFDNDHYNQFETSDLCLEFFKKIISAIEKILRTNDTNEDKITDFLDYNLYKYFEIILSDNQDYWIFPRNYEDELHIDIYEALRQRIIDEQPKQINGEVLNTAIDSETQTVRTFSRAILKVKHKFTRKRNLVKQSFAYSKTKRHHK